MLPLNLMSAMNLNHPLIFIIYYYYFLYIFLFFIFIFIFFLFYKINYIYNVILLLFILFYIIIYYNRIVLIIFCYNSLYFRYFILKKSEVRLDVYSFYLILEDRLSTGVFIDCFFKYLI